MPDVFINLDENKGIKPSELKKEEKELFAKTTVKPVAKSLISAYIRHPQNVDFEIKEKEEKV